MVASLNCLYIGLKCDQNQLWHRNITGKLQLGKNRGVSVKGGWDIWFFKKKKSGALHWSCSSTCTNKRSKLCKNPITHIGLSCSMVRGTSFPCVRLTAERRTQTHLSSSLVGFVWLARIFTLWDFLSAGQFLTFPPNY